MKSKNSDGDNSLVLVVSFLKKKKRKILAEGWKRPQRSAVTDEETEARSRIYLKPRVGEGQ